MNQFEEMNPINNVPKQKTPRSKKMACIECRQQKSKCDAQDLYPNPCTRCSKKNIQCCVQANYKRTYKRAKFQQIEEELHALKKNLASTDSPVNQLKTESPLSTQLSPLPNFIPSNNLPVASNLSSSISSPVSKISVEHGPSIIRDSASPIDSIIRPSSNTEKLTSETQLFPSHHSFQLPDEILFCTPKQFGEVHLSSEQIRELFLEFVNKYHKFLPIVDIKKGPERIYRVCPILFWVIVSIALRHLSTDTLMALAPSLKSALAEITISPITRYLPNEKDEPILNVSSVFSVQAFLLYTFWPPLTSSLSADSSWNTVGIAVFQAIRLGLNAPGTDKYNIQQQHDENMSSILKEHVQTWISCNIVSQTIATAFGFPSFVSFDSSVVECCRPGSQSSVPLSIKHMVEISHFEDQIAKVLNSNNVTATGLVDAAERLPLLKVLTQQLNELELKLTSEGLDDIRKFEIYATKVHLLTYHFLDNSRVANFEVRRGLVSLYNAAINLLNHANTVHKKDPKFIKYVPGVFVLQIWQASCIVAKLTHSTLSSVIDIGAGRQLYMAAIQLTMKASVLKHDMAYRSSGIMRNMWQLFKALREKTNVSNLDVTIKSRMSASVFFDCLWVLREQVGMIKLDPNQKQSSGEDSSNNEGGEEEYNEEEEEEAFQSDEVNEDGIVNANEDPGTVNSESSDAKSSSSTSQKKRPRSLSNNFNAEDAARKIIRTIPLDPAPISLRDERSPSSTSSTLKDLLAKQSPDSLNDIVHRKPKQKRKTNPKPYKNDQTFTNQTQSKNKGSNIHQQQLTVHFTTPANEPISNISRDSTPQMPDISPNSIPSLDMNDDWTSDMLWKDVDSVMNDFGFNIEDLTKSLPAGVTSSTQVQQRVQQQPQPPTPSLFNNR